MIVDWNPETKRLAKKGNGDLRREMARQVPQGMPNTRSSGPRYATIRSIVRAALWRAAELHVRRSGRRSRIKRTMSAMTIRLLTHCLGVAAATAGIILGTLLPFLPGGCDGLAMPPIADVSDLREGRAVARAGRRPLGGVRILVPTCRESLIGTTNDAMAELISRSETDYVEPQHQDEKRESGVLGCRCGFNDALV